MNSDRPAASDRGLSRDAWRLLDMPDGIVYDRHGANNRYVIQKTGSVLALYFTHPDEEPASAIMSEIDLLDPLSLLFGYSRAFMLSLLWKPEPARVFMLGFAGGRVPAVLHHHLPHTVIETAEIDPEVIQIAQAFFGVQPDVRMPVIIEDGRNYLARAVGSSYDIIMLDAFVGPGELPYHLTTHEFFTLCKARLVQNGVVAVNLCSGGPMHRARIETLRAVFATVYIIEYDTALVMFGTDHPALAIDEIVERTAALIGHHQFAFPLLKYAHRVVTPEYLNNYLTAYHGSSDVLRDEEPA